MKIKGICLSAYLETEYEKIANLIKECTPDVEIINFSDVLDDITLLEKVDFIFVLGGDGSSVWLIRTFHEKFGDLSKLKPLVPVVRPESIGYLKQIDMDPKKFSSGYQKLLNDEFEVVDRRVLNVRWRGKDHIAVNEVVLKTSPHLGKYTVYLENGDGFRPITSTMADGIMVSSTIGSTGWALSYGANISLNEHSLQVVVIGGVQGAQNFILPPRKVLIKTKLKNSSISDEGIECYQRHRERLGIERDPHPSKTFDLLYGIRIILDGKLAGFDVSKFVVDAENTVPFVAVKQETTIDKARKLTKQPSVK